MTVWIIVIGFLVLLAAVAGLAFWFYQRRQSENHFHLFRARLFRGKDSVLAESVRQQTINDLSRRLTFLHGLLESTESLRFTASSVADLHYDDVVVLRSLVKSAERDLQMAEFLERKFRAPEEEDHESDSDSIGS